MLLGLGGWAMASFGRYQTGQTIMSASLQLSVVCK